MFDRCTVGLFAALALTAGCRSKEPDQRTPGTAAPKTAEPGPTAASPTCLTADAVMATHPSTEDVPCTPKAIEDLNGDGLPEMQVACGPGGYDVITTIYVQGPSDCFTTAGELVGDWYIEENTAPVNGFVPVRAEAGPMGDGDEPTYYAYDPATRAYRMQDDPTPPPPAATIVLPKKVLRLGGIAGITAGEPGFKGPQPECCLDCDTMIAPLRRIEALVPSLTGKVGPAPLRDAAEEVRRTPWIELFEEVLLNKHRQAYVDGLDSLADAFDATADALYADDGSAAARADDLARVVTKLLAAAAEIGAESSYYCEND